MRDSFPFSIVRTPYLCSNMPSKMFYSSLGAEILRISRNNTELEKFESSCDKIIYRMMKQGGTKSRIKKCLLKNLWTKF